MNEFKWLHLSDLHFQGGNRDERARNANLVDSMLQDIDELEQKWGPGWNAIFITGDLACSGKAHQFAAVASLVIERLMERSTIRRIQRPHVFAVPGNHDLDREAIPREHVEQMARFATDEDLRRRFFGEFGNPLRESVRKAFSAYQRWWSSLGEQPGEHIQGAIPGDFSTRLRTDGGLAIGVVGLNTAFVQLGQGDYKGRLAVTPSQYNDACGGSARDWVRKNDVTFLLTHHPPEWLSPDWLRDFQRPILRGCGERATHGIGVHLFGHLHDAQVHYEAPYASDRNEEFDPVIVGAQAYSLFSTTRWEEGKSGPMERRHGYMAGRLTIDAAGEPWAQVWARRYDAGRSSWSCALEEHERGVTNVTADGITKTRRIPRSRTPRVASGIPPKPGALSIERPELRERLKQAIERGGMLHVYGPQKAGKRRLMAEVSRRYAADDWDVAWLPWHPVEGAAPRLRRELLEALLRRRCDDKTDQERLHALRHHLSSRKCLVVIVVPEQVAPDEVLGELEQFLPNPDSAQSSVVISSTLPSAPRAGQRHVTISVPDFTIDEVREYLRKCWQVDLGRERDPGGNEEELLNRVVEVVGQDVGYLDALLEEPPLTLELLANAATQHRRARMKGIYASRIAELDEVTKGVVRCLRHFPKSATIETCRGLAGGSADKAMRTLVQRRIYKYGNNVYSPLDPCIPKLISEQEPRDDLPDAEVIARVAKLAAQMFERTEPQLVAEDVDAQQESTDALDWFEREFGNLKKCAEIAVQEEKLDILAVLANALLHFNIFRGHLDESRSQFLEPAIEHHEAKRVDSLSEAERIKHWACLANLFNGKGVCHQFSGRWRDAIAAFEATVRLREKALVLDLPKKTRTELLERHAYTYSSLGYVLTRDGQFEEADRAHGCAARLVEEPMSGSSDSYRERLEKELRQTHSNRGYNLTCWAASMAGHSETAADLRTRAMDHLERAIEIGTSAKERGQNDPRVGQAFSRLGDLYRDLHRAGGGSPGSLLSAKKQYGHAIEWQGFRQDHYELWRAHRGCGLAVVEELACGVARTEAEVAALIAEGIEHFEACAEDERGTPEENAEVCEHLAKLYNRIGDLNGAENAREQARKWKTRFGSDHPSRKGW